MSSASAAAAPAISLSSPFNSARRSRISGFSAVLYASVSMAANFAVPGVEKSSVEKFSSCSIAAASCLETSIQASRSCSAFSRFFSICGFLYPTESNAGFAVAGAMPSSARSASTPHWLWITSRAMPLFSETTLI